MKGEVSGSAELPPLPHILSTLAPVVLGLTVAHNPHGSDPSSFEERFHGFHVLRPSLGNDEEAESVRVQQCVRLGEAGHSGLTLGHHSLFPQRNQMNLLAVSPALSQLTCLALFLGRALPTLASADFRFFMIDPAADRPPARGNK